MFVLLLSCQNQNRVNRSEIEIKNGFLYVNNEKFSGIVFENYSNDNLKSEWSVKDGIENGTFTNYYENGELNEKTVWVNGKRKDPMKGIMKMGKWR